MITQARRFADLDVQTLYELLRLRFDVFVLEQDCLYPELDGRDAEVDAWHYWIADSGRVLACLRLLSEPDGGSRIGRVATRASERGKGLAARLVSAALERARRPVHADAQAHLEDWYTQFGFVAAGPEYEDAGILHVPMLLR
jgi:ElaA protein